MNELKPVNQQKLFGFDRYFLELVRLHKNNIYPNKVLFSGSKGIGKSTFAYHFINYVLTYNEDYNYDLDNYEINSESPIYKTVLNKSNTNLISVDINSEKKTIDINQIRDLINSLNKSSFNKKPRFVLIDNIELLNINSINALLKIVEEPNENIYFILINNNKKILPTLLSRCINFKIKFSNEECLEITHKLLGDKLENVVNKDLINYYFTPGNFFYLVKFAKQNNYDLLELDLKQLISLLIAENHYKDDQFIRYIMIDLIEFYFRKLNSSFSQKVNDKYSYFLKKISDTKTFNLDEDSLFSEFNKEILNG